MNDFQILEALYENVISEARDPTPILRDEVGLDEDVIEYLIRLDKKRALWLGNEIAKMPGFQSSKNKTNWIQQNILMDVQTIKDWVEVVPNINIKSFSFEEASRQAREWHDSLETTTLSTVEPNPIIIDYKDGWYWVDLEGTYSKEEEKLMGHCGNTSRGDNLYSLRYFNKAIGDRRSWVTVATAESENIWYQAKGPKNSLPKEEYFEMIADLLVKLNIFIKKTEYDSRHDFNHIHLQETIEGNPQRYPNAEGFLEQIEGNAISQKHFEDAFKEFKDTKFIGLEFRSDGFDEESRVEIDGSFGATLDFKELKKNSPWVFNKIFSDEESDGISLDAIVEAITSETNLSPTDGDAYHLTDRVEFDEDEATIKAGWFIDMEGDGEFSMDEDGLRAFKRAIITYKDLDERISREEIVTAIVDLATTDWVGEHQEKLNAFFDKIGEVKEMTIVKRHGSHVIQAAMGGILKGLKLIEEENKEYALSNFTTLEMLASEGYYANIYGAAYGLASLLQMTLYYHLRADDIDGSVKYNFHTTGKDGLSLRAFFSESDFFVKKNKDQKLEVLKRVRNVLSAFRSAEPKFRKVYSEWNEEIYNVIRENTIRKGDLDGEKIAGGKIVIYPKGMKGDERLTAIIEDKWIFRSYNINVEDVGKLTLKELDALFYTWVKIITDREDLPPNAYLFRTPNLKKTLDDRLIKITDESKPSSPVVESFEQFFYK